MTARQNNRKTLARRHAVAALASASIAAPLATALTARSAQAQATGTARAATPSQTLGPFYPRSPAERPAAVDPDLVVVEGDRMLTKGLPLYLTGRVIGRDGKPAAAALVEIWQCDANAVYHHPDGGAVAQRDPNFQGYGQARTAEDGSFHFRTIKPVNYPGRTAHIHVRVQAQGGATLSTQLYLPGEAGNDNDMIYRRLNAAERALVALDLQPTRADHPLAKLTQAMASVQLVLA